MAKGNSVKIRIDGDASDLEKEITGSVRTANSAAAKMEAAFQRAAKARSEFAKNAAIAAKEDITVTIKGDSSQLKKELSDTQKAAENAADKMQEGMEKAADGASEVVEENKKIISQKEELNDVYDEIGDDAEKASSKVQQMAIRAKMGLADVKAGIDLATQAVKTFASVAEKGIAYNATIEQLKTSFEVMTGSAEKATDVVERLRVMGAETPFETADLAKTTQLLMQYGFNADEAIDRMKMLGDVAQGNTAAMNSIALGYAQMASAGKVNLVDIKQMINGGFNPLQEISERTGESMASLYDRISKGKMTVDEITESMRHATSEGGRFYQSMEKQSQTLNGQLSTLKDNADQLLGSLTEGVSEGLRDQLLPFANNLVSELQTAFDEGGHQGLVNKASEMIPDLLDLMTAKLEKGTPGLVQKLSQNSSKLLQAALPGALKMGAAVTPQIAQGLFEIAGSLVGDLVGMLPELAPVVMEGFVDLFAASYRGIDKGLESVFEGIASAIHGGKTKVAGAWVSDEQLAKFNFKIDTNLVEVESAIEDAYSEIRTALQTDLLTDTQREEIEGMIGEDYDSIKAKLMSFGLTEAEAAPLAETISTAGKTITDAFKGIDVGVDASTLAKWTVEANGSRLLLRDKLKKAGLTDGDINEVLGVYDEMTGKVKDGTPNIMQEIYDKLTDGKPDDKQTVESLKGQIESYISGLLAELETTYKTKLGELDTTAADYEEKKKALDEWYATTKASITEMDTGMRSLVTELANAPTAVVQSKLAEFAALEQQLLGIEQDIDRLNEKARTAAENAFNVVRSGTRTDESTIEQAVNLKITEFALDTQAAEDARDAAIAELNASGKTGEAYEVELGEIEAKYTVDTQAAEERFNTAFAQIIRGIAESEGNLDEINRAGELFGAKMDLQSFLDNMFTEAGGLNTEALSGVSSTLATLLGSAFSSDMLQAYAAEGNTEGISSYINQMLSTLDVELDESAQAAFGERIGSVYQTLLDSGLAEGTAFDTSTIEGQLSAIFATVDFGSIASGVQSQATAAAVSVATEATDAEKSAAFDGSKTAGETVPTGTAVGIGARAHVAINAAAAMARAVVAKIRAVFDSHSPSRVAMSIGGDFGEGMSIGLQKSMANAVAVAQRMSGQIVTSADISQSMRVNIPTLTQDIILANEQSDRSVSLYVNGKELGRVMATDNQLAQNRYNRSIALGVGKK